MDVRSRFEERDAAITYNGTWAQENMDRAWSGTSANAGSGTAAVSTVAGAIAEFTFTGTTVSWISFRSPLAGMADVFLNGSFVRMVDLYSATEELRVPVFEATLPDDGPHTLQIVVRGDSNPAASAAFVVIDAFDVTPPASAPPVRRLQQTDPSVVYTGTWTESSGNGLFSGRTVAFSTTAGARADFTFSGSSVRWIGQRRYNAGIARVSVDGGTPVEIDLFAPVQDEYQAAGFSVTGLAPGVTHTLTIEGTGTNSAGFICDPTKVEPATCPTIVVVDAFDVY